LFDHLTDPCARDEFGQRPSAVDIHAQHDVAIPES